MQDALHLRTKYGSVLDISYDKNRFTVMTALRLKVMTVLRKPFLQTEKMRRMVSHYGLIQSGRFLYIN